MGPNSTKALLLEWEAFLDVTDHQFTGRASLIDAFLEKRKGKPIYPHECAECEFLGNWTDPEDSRKYDLYVCPQKGHGLTYVARYGTDEHYRSGASFVGIDPAITEAHRRYKSRG